MNRKGTGSIAEPIAQLQHEGTPNPTVNAGRVR